jgi:hypothetical protein
VTLSRPAAGGTLVSLVVPLGTGDESVPLGTADGSERG